MTQNEYLLRMYAKLREATIKTGRMVAAGSFDSTLWKEVNEAIFEAGMARAGYVMRTNGAVQDDINPTPPAEVDKKLEFAAWLRDHGKLASSAVGSNATLVEQSNERSGEVQGTIERAPEKIQREAS